VVNIQILAPATDQSYAATSSTNAISGVGRHHAALPRANLHSAPPLHHLPPPAVSFIEGFRTPATVQTAASRSAGLRNPQHLRRPWQQAAGRHLPLCPVCDRSRVATQHVAPGHKRSSADARCASCWNASRRLFNPPPHNHKSSLSTGCLTGTAES
jgi:hypothetical protein